MILRAFGERILFLKKLQMTIKIISIGNKLNSWESESIDYYKKQLPKNLSLNPKISLSKNMFNLTVWPTLMVSVS